MAKGRSVKVKNPKIYAWAVERGYAPKNIPPRPLFARSLAGYEDRYNFLVKKAVTQILAAWS